jgi:HTH-type transcriptional regulator/antitoxin HigA
MLSVTGMPVIGLTLRYDRIDSFWFTLLHEVSHIALHYSLLLKSKAAFIDDMDIRSEDVCEREADELARNVLIPVQFLAQVNWGPDTSQDEIVTVATRARVHVAIVAGRWQRDHQNYKRFSRVIERDTLRAMLAA